MRKKTSEKGSVFFYILGALALLGVLVATLAGGPQKSATTGQLDALSTGVYGDIEAASSLVSECILAHSAPVDADGDGDIDSADNPNPPFPLYDSAGTKGGSGGTGVTLDFSDNNLVCPGAAPGVPANMPVLFSSRNAGMFRVLTDTATYDLHYRNEAGAGAEGVLLRVTRATADPLWEEAAARVNGRFSDCKAFYVKDGVTDGGACTNGCLYYWIVRLEGNTIGHTDDSGTTCP